MIASGIELDIMADSIIQNFHRDETARFPRTDIDHMAEQFLRLSVRYTDLSDDRSLLGLTAYEETQVKIQVDGKEETLVLERDMVLLERWFIQRWVTDAEQERRNKQRRFTLAHECAHQILFRLEPKNIRNNLRKQYAECRLYSCHDLKTKEDWNEWQANTLGAALLMPRTYIERYFAQFQRNKPLISYEGKYAARERLAMYHLTRIFDVSARAMEIRLKGMGLMVVQPRWLYQDSFDMEEGDEFEW